MRESRSSGWTSMKESGAPTGFCAGTGASTGKQKEFRRGFSGRENNSPRAVWRFSCVGGSGLVDQGSESEEREAIFSWRAKPAERSAD